MIWNASGGTTDEDEALLLLPQPLELEACPAASVSVFIGSPSAWSPSSSLSLGRQTCILVMVSLLMAKGVAMRLIS